MLPATRFLYLLSTCAAGLVMACGGASAQPARHELSPAPAPATATGPGKLPAGSLYFPGEVMTFEMSFRGVAGGKATLMAGEPGVVAGRRALIVRSRAESSGIAKLVKEIRDDVTSWIDLTTGTPIEYHADLIFGDKHMLLKSRFAGQRVNIEYLRHNRKNPRPPRQHKRRFVMPAGERAYDAHAALGAVRAWSPRPGEVVSFYALSGRRMWRNTLTFTGSETVRFALGVYPTLRLEGVAVRLTTRLAPDRKKKPRSYVMWLSDDANRMPLRVVGKTEYGEVAVELVGYERGPGEISLRQ